jgi:spermidine/putrescine-binding protein
LNKKLAHSLPIVAATTIALAMGAAGPAAAAGGNATVTLTNSSGYTVGWGGFYHDGDYFLVKDTFADGKGIQLYYVTGNQSGYVRDTNGANGDTIRVDKNFPEGQRISIRVCQLEGQAPVNCHMAWGTT